MPKKSKVGSIFDDPMYNPDLKPEQDTGEDSVIEGEVISSSIEEPKKSRGRAVKKAPAAPKQTRKAQAPKMQKGGNTMTTAKLEKLKEQVTAASEAVKEEANHVKEARLDVKTAKSELAPFAKALAAAEKQLNKDLKAQEKAKEKLANLKEKLAEAKAAG